MREVENEHLGERHSVSNGKGVEKGLSGKWRMPV